MVRKIIRPTITRLLDDCPKEIRTKFHFHEGIYKFKNGSELQVEGVANDTADNLRGTPSHLSIVDEAGFIDDLDYLIADVLTPMTLTTKGRLLMASTPPKTPGHPFKKYAEDAQFKGVYIKQNILEHLELIKNDPEHFKQRITPEQVEIIKQSCGGDQSTTWLREYMCMFIQDTESAVIPEFNEAMALKVVQDWPRPKFYDAYTAMDLGFNDFHAVLFAYYDFASAKLVIEDEYLIAGRLTDTSRLAAMIRQKEHDCWSDKHGNSREPYMRVSDDNMLVINDLINLHNLQFLPTRKDDKDAAINQVRMKFSSNSIVIHPRCKNLIYQLKTAVWDSKRKSFARSADAGHYDLIDTLIYLVRNVQYNKNPFPSGWDKVGTALFRPIKDQIELSPTLQAVKSIFIKKRQ
jgi:hypothetical protein